MDSFTGKPKLKTATKHVFQVHSYRKPTFCAHCKNLLVGLTKQGLQCKRCEINVHKKCQEDVTESCIEVIVGHHNFLERTYKSPEFCDWCGKLLAGVINQGLHCSECGSDVHEKCQGKIEVQCAKTKARLEKDKLAKHQSHAEKKTRSHSKSSSSSRDSIKRPKDKNLSASNAPQKPAVFDKMEMEPTNQDVFHKMEKIEDKADTPKPSPHPSPRPSPHPSPKPSPKVTRYPPTPSSCASVTTETMDEKARILMELDKGQEDEKLCSWCCC